MLYNLSVRENGASYFLLACIFTLIPRLGSHTKIYFLSVAFSLLAAFLLHLPVYRIHGMSGNFNYSKWFVYHPGYAEPDTVWFSAHHEIKSLYFHTPDKQKIRHWMILLHGGGFTSGNASHMSHLGNYFARKNVPAVSLDYSLSPESTFPLQIREIDSLIKEIRSDSKYAHFSHLPFYILGESAGATIALNYAHVKPDEKLKGIINLYGITDAGFIQPESAISHANLIEMTEAYRGGTGPDPISPLRNAIRIKVPVYSFHGTSDIIVPDIHARMFHEKRLELGFRNDRLYLLPGATHLFDHPLNGPSGQFFQNIMEELILANE